MRIVQESENLYRLTRFDMFNCFLVKESNEFTLVDTNFPGSCNDILKGAAALNCRINRIVLTHAHFDHVGRSMRLLRRCRMQKYPLASEKHAFYMETFPSTRGRPESRCSVSSALGLLSTKR
jgi:glyoxylase-like metal-dependent hydrolase (beta-lactamase superfamily II)